MASPSRKRRPTQARKTNAATGESRLPSPGDDTLLLIANRVMNRMSVLAEEGRVWPELETFRQMVARFPVSYAENNENCGDSNTIGGIHD